MVRFKKNAWESRDIQFRLSPSGHSEYPVKIKTNNYRVIRKDFSN